MQHPNLDEVSRRPQKYWNVDGLPDLVMGVCWIVLGGAWLVGQTLPRDWKWGAYWTIVPALLALNGFAAVWTIKRLKARLTFPRAGYVQWREPTRAINLMAALIAVVVAAVLAATLVRSDESAGMHAAPIVGAILSLAFVVTTLKQRAPHYLALAAISVVLGLALAGVEHAWAATSWLFVGVGAAASLVGAMRLAIFMKRHARPSMEGA